MREFQIFSDSSCDSPGGSAATNDIRVIPFYISFDQDIYYKENVDITNSHFLHGWKRRIGFTIGAYTGS